jgi:hypothetical protein
LSFNLIQIGEFGLAHPGANAEHDEQRHEQAHGGRRLDPRRVESALVLRGMFGDVDGRPAVLAAERQPLEQAQADQRDRRSDSPRGIIGQQADAKCAQPHQRHGDEEGVFAADQVAESAEEQGSERPHRKSGGKGEQGKDEGRRRIDAGKELRGENRSERAVDVEIVPLENCAERRCEDDQPLLGCHRSFLI